MTKSAALVVAVISTVGLISPGAFADQPGAVNLITVNVVGLHSSDGAVNCALFGSADGFPGDAAKAIKTANVAIKDHQAVCRFADVPAGDYAVSVYHDENSNGKLDRNFMGIPKEGVGASNDAKTRFGPPKFDDARFDYPGGAGVLTIHVRYLLAPL